MYKNNILRTNLLPSPTFSVYIHKEQVRKTSNSTNLNISITGEANKYALNIKIACDNSWLTNMWIDS